MSEKVFLILVDGMRIDAPDACGNEYAAQFGAKAKLLRERTVMPSVTLPCHMSLFHSVTPQRHGILTNTFVPQVHTVEGLVERLKASGKTSAFYYSWQLLRDLTRPGCLSFELFIDIYAYPHVDRLLTGEALARTEKDAHDFVFLYLGEPDETGHAHGYMGPEYLASVSEAWDCVRRVCEKFGGQYQIIVTADHGGHDRIHGEDIPEDMNIPLYLYGSAFDGYTAQTASIIDIAPTIAKIMGIEPARGWDGKAIPGVG